MKIGILPCGGKNSRFYPYPCAKELFPFGSFKYMGDEKPKPVILYAVESMLQAGVEKIYFIINSNKMEILDFFHDGIDFGFDAGYFCQEMPIGSGAAFTLPSNFVDDDDLIYFQMPDNILIPLDHFITLSESINTEDVILGVFPSKHPHFFGRIDTTVGMVKQNQKPSEIDQVMGSGILSGKVFKKLYTLCRTESDKIININDPQKELRLSTLLSYYESTRTRLFKYISFKNGQCVDIGNPADLGDSYKQLKDLGIM